MDGFILIDKPAGITSHDVIDRLRRITGLRRIGHGGTLDPFATGLLVVGIGKATKRLAEVSGSIKEYVGTMVLGAVTDTQDLTGVKVEKKESYKVEKTDFEKVLPQYTGKLLQTPPMYSAKKVGGKKLYELARQGIEIERKPVPIEILELELVSFDFPRATIRVICSSGTYIRTLSHDIGHALGCGAYLESLRRTAVGPHRIEKSASLADLTPTNWQEKLIAL